MLVYRMTEQEVEREVLHDMYNVFRFDDARQNKFRRRVIKSNSFPAYSKYTYNSPLKNRWLVFLEARNKKEIRDYSRVTFVVTYDTPHGIYAIMVSWVDGKPQLIFYPPHFFSRFKIRFKTEKTGIELLCLFFKFNSSYVYDVANKTITENIYESDIAGSTKDGVCLGFVTAENNIMFKTFVTYDMLKGEQVEKYMRNEELRKEIHEST